MNKKTVKDIPIAGKRVLVRADFNVPLDDNRNITDDGRIVKTLPTLEYILSQNSKLILMSHLGRPKGVTPEFSLAPVAKRLEQLLKRKITFLGDCVGDEVKSAV